MAADSDDTRTGDNPTSDSRCARDAAASPAVREAAGLVCGLVCVLLICVRWIGVGVSSL